MILLSTPFPAPAKLLQLRYLLSLLELTLLLVLIVPPRIASLFIPLCGCMVREQVRAVSVCFHHHLLVVKHCMRCTSRNISHLCERFLVPTFGTSTTGTTGTDTIIVSSSNSELRQLRLY
jgi:hypothetical protein